MRKLFTIVIAIILAMGLTTSAFALDSPQTVKELEGGEKSVEIGVTGTYEGSDSKTEVYSVNVEWGKMEFTYRTTGSSKWNPDTHKYETHTDKPGWVAEGNNITVTNHSSLPVNVAFTFEKDENMGNGSSYTGGEFQKVTDTGNEEIAQGTNIELARATENSPVEDAPSLTAMLNMTGELTADYTNGVKLGTVTVKLSPVAP